MNIYQHPRPPLSPPWQGGGRVYYINAVNLLLDFDPSRIKSSPCEGEDLGEVGAKGFAT